MTGYSGTPLVKKLGIKPGERVVTIDAPTDYARLVGELPAGASLSNRLGTRPRFVHLFVRERRKLARELARLRRVLDDAGTLWVSWPKKAVGLTSDVSEDVIRHEALPLGFVDVKVCAVDETWSGLKLVIRRELRAKK